MKIPSDFYPATRTNVMPLRFCLLLLIPTATAGDAGKTNAIDPLLAELTPHQGRRDSARHPARHGSGARGPQKSRHARRLAVRLRQAESQRRSASARPGHATRPHLWRSAGADRAARNRRQRQGADTGARGRNPGARPTARRRTAAVAVRRPDRPGDASPGLARPGGFRRCENTQGNPRPLSQTQQRREERRHQHSRRPPVVCPRSGSGHEENNAVPAKDVDAFTVRHGFMGCATRICPTASKKPGACCGRRRKRSSAG